MIEKIVVSPSAELDVARQRRWYEESSNEKNAERYLDAFHSTLETLRRFPGMGQRRRFRNAQLLEVRSFGMRRPFGANLIFYRIDSSTLTVLRVVHGARDLPRRLLERPS